MTDQERHRLARAIYEGRCSVYAVGAYKPWGSLQDHEKWCWLCAADTAYAAMRVIEAGRIAAGRAA